MEEETDVHQRTRGKVLNADFPDEEMQEAPQTGKGGRRR